MKILFDEDIPHKLVPFLPQHEVHTVVSMQWGGIKNGELLTIIELEAFDVSLTGDKRMQNEQHLEGRAFAVLVLSAINWPVIEPHVEKISGAVDAAKPGTLEIVECGEFVPRSKRRSE